MKIEIEVKKDTFCITRKNLAIFLGVSKQQLISYGKPHLYSPPLETIDKDFYGIKSTQSWYDFKQAVIWHKNNVKQKHSPKKQHTGLQTEENSDLNEYDPYNDKITTSNMKVAKELESALNEKIKREKEQIALEVEKGNFVHIEEADKTVAVSVRVLLSELYNMIENLPSRLDDCTNTDEIKNVLEDEFEDLINEIKAKLVGLSQDE